MGRGRHSGGFRIDEGVAQGVCSRDIYISVGVAWLSFQSSTYLASVEVHDGE